MAKDVVLFGTGDFETGNPSPLFDAWVEYTKLRDLNLRVGQYFVPFDRARTVRESGLQFVDRQIAVRELTLDRDVGLMASSSDLFGLNQWLAYNLFIGGGDGRNRIGGAVMGPILVGRVAVRPFGSSTTTLKAICSVVKSRGSPSAWQAGTTFERTARRAPSAPRTRWAPSTTCTARSTSSSSGRASRCWPKV